MNALLCEYPRVLTSVLLNVYPVLIWAGEDGCVVYNGMSGKKKGVIQQSGRTVLQSRLESSQVFYISRFCQKYLILCWSRIRPAERRTTALVEEGGIVMAATAATDATKATDQDPTHHVADQRLRPPFPSAFFACNFVYYWGFFNCAFHSFLPSSATRRPSGAVGDPTDILGRMRAGLSSFFETHSFDDDICVTRYY